MKQMNFRVLTALIVAFVVVGVCLVFSYFQTPLIVFEIYDKKGISLPEVLSVIASFTSIGTVVLIYFTFKQQVVSSYTLYNESKRSRFEQGFFPMLSEFRKCIGRLEFKTKIEYEKRKNDKGNIERKREMINCNATGLDAIICSAQSAEAESRIVADNHQKTDFELFWQPLFITNYADLMQQLEIVAGYLNHMFLKDSEEIHKEYFKLLLTHLDKYLAYSICFYFITHKHHYNDITKEYQSIEFANTYELFTSSVFKKWYKEHYLDGYYVDLEVRKWLDITIES